MFYSSIQFKVYRKLSLLLLAFLPLYSSATANASVSLADIYTEVSSYEATIDHDGINLPHQASMPAFLAEANERTVEEDEQNDQDNDSSGAENSINSSYYISHCLSITISEFSLAHSVSIPLYSLHHAWKHFLS